MSLASIVIPVHGGLEYTVLCLATIEAHTTEPHEVVLVDNASPDATADWFAEHGRGRLVRSSTNLGYAGGVNLGLEAASGDLCVVLNNDTVVSHGWLTALAGALDRDPTLGIAAPRSNYTGGAALLPGDELGYEDAPSPELDAFARERHEALHARGFATERLSGMCMAIPARTLDLVGGFDTDFRVGNYEDDDLCLRVRLAGLGLWVCEDSYVHHFGGKTFERIDEAYEALLYENQMRYAFKWDLPLDRDVRGMLPDRPFDPRADVIPLLRGVGAQVAAS